MSRVARSGTDQAAQLKSLVKLLGGKLSQLSSLLEQVEQETGLRFSTPCLKQVAVLAKSRNNLLSAEVLGLVVRPNALCGGPGVECDWSVEEVRALAEASKECNAAVRKLQHVADFYAFTEGGDWIPYALWLSKNHASLKTIRFRCGSVEIQMIPHLLRECGTTNTLVKAQFQVCTGVVGRWPLLAETVLEAWRDGRRENYLNKNFPAATTSLVEHVFQNLIELEADGDVQRFFLPHQCPALENLSTCLGADISVPTYLECQRDGDYHATIAWLNAMPSLKKLSLQGGYNAKLVFGRDDSPLEFLDVSGAYKSMRVAQLNCPRLRQIRVRPTHFGAGLWVVSSAPSGSLYLVQEDDSQISDVTLKFSPCVGDQNYPEFPLDPSWVSCMGKEVRVPVTALPEGLRWGNIDIISGGVMPSVELTVSTECAVTWDRQVGW